jgi:stage II sporulation protein D
VPPQSAKGPAYLVLELPSQRVIAEARPDVLSHALLPGSIIKLATLIAAVEDGIIDDSTRITCRRTVTVDGTQLTCAHPDLHRPLDAAEALGYSCNVFFASVAQRLRRSSLDAALVRMGLPPLAADAPTASGALGLAGIRATPRQLLEAFLRVVGAARVEITLSGPARATLRRGVEIAARTGTASALAAAGFSGLAKTGTAPMPGGGYLGVVTAAVNTELPTHAIVVVVPGGAGADAAELAARLLTRYGAAGRGDSVRVGVANRGGGYDVTSMPLEAYVSRVAAGEMGNAAAPALEAMAITVRTFVAANRGRHAAEGFDLCDLTHCQVLARATAATDAAALATSGQVLVENGRPAHVFFSSWCGGHTDKPSRVWPGARDVAYLPAQPDPACAGDPPWTVDIAEPRLRQALEAAGLKGSGVSAFSVATRQPSGRVALLQAAGMTPDHVDANVFRTAAGRLLGWQTVKSTLFDVRRSSTGYVLTGRGSGHGVGLCVRGAMKRASGGAGRDEILAAYFPGLTVASRPRNTQEAMTSTIRVHLPEADRRSLLEVRDLAARLLGAVAVRLGVPLPTELDLRFSPTVEAYTRATGQPWWTAARTAGTGLDLLPLGVLRDRGILESTLTHEFVHVLADPVLPGRPLWTREGLAVFLAGELAIETAGRPAPAGAKAPVCPSDVALRSPASAESWRRAYRDAGRCVAWALSSGGRWQDLR